MKNKRLQSKGITLIALVITVIVLLILAGVAIQALSGPNGILNNSVEAKKQTNMKNILEKANLAKQDVISQNVLAGKETTKDEIVDKIVEELGGNKNGNLITEVDDEYEIMVKDDNQIEVVEKGEGYVDAIYKDPAPESDFRYEVTEDNEIRILEYLGSEESLNIPDTIEGKPVTMLWADEAYYTDIVINSDGTQEPSSSRQGGNIARDKTIKSLKIPNTVKIIEMFAFSDSEIETLYLSSGLESIRNSAFFNNNIKVLEIPEGVEVIGQNAFSASNIEKLVIPDTVIDSGAFSSNNLTEINLPPNLIYLGGGVFTGNKVEKMLYGITDGKEDKTKFNSYCGRHAEGNLDLEGIVTIEFNALNTSSGVENLIIPEGVETINTIWLNGVKTLVIPSTVNKMGLFFVLNDMEYLEFKGEGFDFSTTRLGIAGKVQKIKVPYSEDHSILNYYKELLSRANGPVYIMDGYTTITDEYNNVPFRTVASCNILLQ